jgi:tetratricopeptide (TPR) repeat protein
MPVVARPDTRWYRASRFVQRNALPVGLAATAAFVLIAGSIATLAQAGRANAEARRANVELERAVATREFLERTFGDFDPDLLGGLGRIGENGDQREFTVDELLDRAAQNLEEYSDRPELYAVIANTLAQIRIRLGRDEDTRQALDLFLRAYAILEPLGDHPDLAVSMMGIGEVSRRTRQFVDAERWFREALRVREAVYTAGDQHIAETLVGLAFSLYNQNTVAPAKLDEADEMYARAAAFGDVVPTDIRARIQEGFGDVRLARRNWAEAESFYGRSLELRSRDSARADPPGARAMWGLGYAIAEQGRREEALAVHLQSRDALLEAYGARHHDVGIARYWVGRGMFGLGRLDEAEAELSHAAQVLAAVSEPDYLYTAVAWDELGQVQLQRRLFSEAVQSLTNALSIYDVHPHDPEVNPGMATPYYTARSRRGAALAGQGGRDESALTDLREAYAVFTASLRSPVEAKRAAAVLAELYRRVGPPDSASIYARRAATSPAGT